MPASRNRSLGLGTRPSGGLSPLSAMLMPRFVTNTQWTCKNEPASVHQANKRLGGNFAAYSNVSRHSRMGFSFTSVAVRGVTPDAVLATMGLLGTNTFEGIPESNITGASLPSGWYLVTANRGLFPTFAEDPTLKRLSQTAEVVTCFVEEHVMCSAASLWADGREVWSVMHAADQNIEHLQTKGSLPPMFAAISERLRAEQAAAGGKKAKVDHIFDIPVEMVAQLTGYRHDRVMPELGDRAFEVLATTAATPKRSLLRRLLGV